MDNQTPPITPPLPQQPAAIPPPVKKSPLLILAGSSVIILLAVSGLLAYQNLKLQQQIVTLQTQPTPTPSLTPTPTTDPTANWKTYTDKNEKISFSYPENWQLLEDQGGTYITDNDKKIQLRTTGGPKNLTIKEDLHNYLEKQTSYGTQDLGYITEKQVKVDGANGWYANIKISALNQEDLIVFIENKNLADRYTGLWLTNTSAQDQAIFDQILSTFKFIDT